MILIEVTRRLPDEGVNGLCGLSAVMVSCGNRTSMGYAYRKCQSWMPQWVRHIGLCEGSSCSCKVMETRVRRVERPH